MNSNLVAIPDDNVTVWCTHYHDPPKPCHTAKQRQAALCSSHYKHRKSFYEQALTETIRQDRELTRVAKDAEAAIVLTKKRKRVEEKKNYTEALLKKHAPEITGQPMMDMFNHIVALQAQVSQLTAMMAVPNSK